MKRSFWAYLFLIILLNAANANAITLNIAATDNIIVIEDITENATATAAVVGTTENISVTGDIIIIEDITENATAISPTASLAATPSIKTTTPTLSIKEEATALKKEKIVLPKEGESKGRYPKLNIEGYKEYEFMKMEKTGDPQQYETDPSYKLAAAKILPTAGSSGLLRERLRLDIEGKLSEKLSVSYHLEQEPDLPDKFDIKVRYDKTELTFGDFNADFKTREFINFNKAMNGFMLTSYDDWYDLKIVTAKERSTAKEITFKGNGQNVYSLGETSILEGSVKVYVNDIRVYEGADYEIDYFDGKIIFKTIKATTDTIVVQYEFTDPIEELIPVATKVDFLGIQGAVRTFAEQRKEKRTKDINKEFVVEQERPKTTYGEPAYLFPNVQTSFSAEPTESVVLVKFEGTFPRDIRTAWIQFSEEFVLSMYSDKNVFNGKWNGEIFLPRGFHPAQAKLILATNKATFSKIIELNLPKFAPKPVTVSAKALEPTVNEYVFVGTDIYEKVPPKGALFENKEGTKLIVAPARIEPGEKMAFLVYSEKDWAKVEVVWLDGQIIELTKEGEYWSASKTLTGNIAPGERSLVLKLKADGKEQQLPFNVQVLEKPIITSQKVFKLEGVPVVFGSEDVFLNGEELRAYSDYSLNYDTGELKLQKLSVTPADKFEVRYKYIENKKLTETFNGLDSRGPYKLQNRPVINKSVKIFLGSKELEENVDYSFDYQKGEVFFALKIDKVQKVTVEYAYVLMKEPPEDQKPEESFYLQTTYLKESADAGDRAEQDVDYTDDTDGGVVVSQNGDLIILSELALPIKEIDSVLVNGVALPAVSYNVEEYRGYIIVTPSGSVSDDAEVTVKYSYYKTNILPAQPYKVNGSELIMETQTSYLPIVYHSEEISRRWYDPSTGLWREDILHRGEDYVLGPLVTATNDNTILIQEDKEDYWAEGYITFITRNALNSYQAREVQSGEEVRIKYKYAVGEQPDFGNISHQVYGFNTQYKINPDWKIGLEAMKSEKRFNRAVAAGRFSWPGTGVYGQRYQINNGSPVVEIVEDSEKVYLNDFLQTKNDAYVISYTTGTIRFKNGINPGVSDNILVIYDYYSQTGELLAQSLDGTAYKANTDFKLGDFKVGTSYMAIDRKFETIGAMRQAPGTKLSDLSVEYVPDDRLRISSFVENRHTLVGNKDNDDPLYKSTYLQKYNGHWEFIPQQMLDFDYQQNDVVQENSSLVTRDFTIDTLDRNYNTKLSVGPSYFRTLWEEKRTEVYTDFLDRTNLTTTLGLFRNVNNFYKPWSFLTFTSDYQYDNTESDVFPWYVETIERGQETITYFPYPTWENKLDYTERSKKRRFRTAPRIIDVEKTILYNYFYASTLRRPSEWTDPFYKEFYLHFDRNYSQEENPLLGQAPDTEDKDNFNFSFRPWDLFRFSRDSGRMNALKGDELDRSVRNTHRTGIGDFRPLKLWPGSPLRQDFFIVDRVSYGDGVYNRDNQLGTASTSGNSTYEESYDFDIGLISKTFEHTELKYLYNESNKEIMYDTRYEAYEDSSFSESPKYARTYGLSYTPGDYDLKIPFLPAWHWTKTNFWADVKYSSELDQTTKFSSNTANETITKKDRDYNEDNENLKFNPFPPLMLDLKRKNTGEYMNQTGAGTRQSLGLGHDMNWTYDTPWTQLQLNGYFSGVKDIQHTAPSLDRTIEELYDDWDTYLERLDKTDNYGLAYTPFAQLTLRSSYTNNNIYQKEIAGAVTGLNLKDLETNINSKIYSAGLVYRPFSGFSISYDWALKYFEEGNGERTTIKARYQPFDWILGTCVFNYEYVYNSGIGLNEVDQLIAEKNQAGFVATTVGKVANEKMTGSLDLQILNDVNSLVVEGTEVVATWTLIKLADYINADNNYSVNALYLKGRIIF